MSTTQPQRKKLIEVALPLEATNQAWRERSLPGMDIHLPSSLIPTLLFAYLSGSNF
jgi:hypothetical protein